MATIPPLNIASARFFGGPWDGRVESLPPSLLMGFRVPEPVNVADMMSAFSEPPSLYPVNIPRIHLYRWDGTINDAGERRMRWVGEQRY